MTPYLPLLVFALLYAGASHAWHLTPLAGAAYLAMSLACFIAYALDKSAARKGERRTPESTLLVLGLFGGWPGAVLAQQWLRHKTVKQPFRQMFWFSVTANMMFFLWLSKRIAA